MRFVRQSLQRLVNVFGSNPFHHGIRNCAIGVNHHSTLWRKGFLSQAVDSFTTKPLTTFHVLSQGGVTSLTQAGQVLEDKQDEKSEVAFKELRLQKNKSEILSGIRQHICDECGKGFKTAQNLKIHKGVHSDLRPFSCNKCDKTFKFEGSLRDHVKRVHLETYVKRVHLDGHEFNENVVACPHCGIGFTNIDALQTHIDLAEKGQMPSCKESWLQKNESEIISGKKKHICDECGKGFKDAHKLQIHKTVHSDLRPFSCSQCDKTFKREGGLAVHVKKAHLQQKYSCPDCKKEFTTKQGMTEHWKTACQGEKDFKCVQCGKEFGIKKHLDQHIRLVHDKIHPFTCEVCSKTFGVKANYKLHMLIHHPTTAAQEGNA